MTQMLQLVMVSMTHDGHTRWKVCFVLFCFVLFFTKVRLKDTSGFHEEGFGPVSVGVSIFLSHNGATYEQGSGLVL